MDGKLNHGRLKSPRVKSIPPGLSIYVLLAYLAPLGRGQIGIYA